MFIFWPFRVWLWEDWGTAAHLFYQWPLLWQQLALSPTYLLVDGIHPTPVRDEDSLTRTFTFKAMAGVHSLGLINPGLL